MLRRLPRIRLAEALNGRSGRRPPASELQIATAYRGEARLPLLPVQPAPDD
jgi:hypothetical protein